MSRGEPFGETARRLRRAVSVKVCRIGPKPRIVRHVGADGYRRRVDAEGRIRQVLKRAAPVCRQEDEVGRAALSGREAQDFLNVKARKPVFKPIERRRQLVL